MVLPDQVSSLKLVQVGFDGPARNVRSMWSAVKEPWLMLMLMLVGSKLQLTPVCKDGCQEHQTKNDEETLAKWTDHCKRLKSF
jgi:hypothetical protein